MGQGNVGYGLDFRKGNPKEIWAKQQFASHSQLSLLNDNRFFSPVEVLVQLSVESLQLYQRAPSSDLGSQRILLFYVLFAWVRLSCAARKASEGNNGILTCLWRRLRAERFVTRLLNCTDDVPKSFRGFQSNFSPIQGRDKWRVPL